MNLYSMLSRTGILIFLLALTTPAFAYLDPVTGNIVVQALMVAAAAIAVSFHKVKAYINSKLRRRTPDECSQSNQNTPDSDEGQYEVKE